jgi:hypothetical protein
MVRLHKVLTSIPIQRVTLKLLTSTCGACGCICRAIILDSTHSLVKNQGGGSGDGEFLLPQHCDTNCVLTSG